MIAVYISGMSSVGLLQTLGYVISIMTERTFSCSISCVNYVELGWARFNVPLDTF